MSEKGALKDWMLRAFQAYIDDPDDAIELADLVIAHLRSRTAPVEAWGIWYGDEFVWPLVTSDGLDSEADKWVQIYRYYSYIHNQPIESWGDWTPDDTDAAVKWWEKMEAGGFRAVRVEVREVGDGLS
jgi:hypothetical protein